MITPTTMRTSRLFSLLLIALQIHPSAARAEDPSPNPGVEMGEVYGRSTEGANVSAGTSATPSEGRKLPGASDLTPGSGASSSGSTGTVASLPADLAKSSCEQKCAPFVAHLNALAEDPICKGNPECNSCFLTRLGSTQVGRYCTALEGYEKAKGHIRTTAIAYNMGAAACLAAAMAESTGVGATLKPLCVGASFATLAAEIMAMKQISEFDRELASWALKSDPKIGLTSAGLASFAQLGISQKALKVAVKKVSEKLAQNSALPSLASYAFLQIAALSRTGAWISLKPERDKLCGYVDQVWAQSSSAVNQCVATTSAPGLGSQSGTYQRPKNFTVEDGTQDPGVGAILGEGRISDVFRSEQQRLQEDFARLPTGLQERIKNGESVVDAFAAEGLIAGKTLETLREFEAKSQGQKSAFISFPDQDGAMIAGAPAPAPGSSEGGAFGNAVRVGSIAAPGEGVEELGFQSGMASGTAPECGSGVFHEGCQDSLFSLVTRQLHQKSRAKDVADLQPVLRLNRMLSGLKVEAGADGASGPGHSPDKIRRRTPASTGNPLR